MARQGHRPGRHPRPRTGLTGAGSGRHRVGHRRTRQGRHQRGPLGAPRHERRLDHRTHRHPRAPHRGHHRRAGHRGRVARHSRGPGRTGDDIDVLVLATSTPDALVPGTSATVQDGLGVARRRLRRQRGVLGLRLRAGGRPRAGPGRGPAGPRHRQRDAVADHRLGRPQHGRPRGRRRRCRACSRPPTGPASCWRGTSGPTGRCATCLKCDHGGYLYMNGKEIFRHAVRVVVDSSLTALGRAGLDAGRRRPLRPPPGQRPHHHRRQPAARHPRRPLRGDHRPLRQHLLGLDPPGAGRRPRDGPPPTRGAWCCCRASAAG